MPRIYLRRWLEQYIEYKAFNHRPPSGDGRLSIRVRRRRPIPCKPSRHLEAGPRPEQSPEAPEEQI